MTWEFYRKPFWQTAMSDTPRRLRIFAGPNGSGKSSLVRSLAKECSPKGRFRLGHWVNADEIEAALHDGAFELNKYRIDGNLLLDKLSASPRIQPGHPFLLSAKISGSILVVNPQSVDSYVAASIADIIRQELLDRGESFSYETVMSHHSKVDFLRLAQAANYQIYLHFIATQSVAINLGRIANRVQLGLHAVPTQKVIERYARSIRLLPDALRLAYRAYLFDNTGVEPVWFAEKTPDGSLILNVSTEEVPRWYRQVMEK